MPEILTDLSLRALIRANEENEIAMTPFSHKWKNVEVYRGRDISWCITNIACPMCNAAFHAHLTPENTDATIEKFLAQGTKRNVPLQWYIGREVQATNLPKRLEAHGFTTYGDSAAMALDLREMAQDVPLPDGLEIKAVENDADIKHWSHVVCGGFGAPPHAEPEMFKWFKTDKDLGQPVKMYLGWLEGKPVAASNYYLAAGVVGIYCVATLPEARNKGIGYAITQAPLQDGKKMGYRIATLQASKMGAPIYRKMGFKETHRSLNYTWRPESMREKKGETENA